jgi:hypothetical protein
MAPVAALLAVAFTLTLASCGPVELRADANRAVYRYDPDDASLPEVAALARQSCARWGKRAAFSELTASDARDPLADALFDCLPQTAQAPPAMP